MLIPSNEGIGDTIDDEFGVTGYDLSWKSSSSFSKFKAEGRFYSEGDIRGFALNS